MKKVTYLTESAKKFTKEEAIAEAKRCLLCEEAYCNKRCPINSNPKEFVKLVATEQFEKAIKLIRDNNPLFYSICTRVCPYDSYCVGGCRKSALGDNPIMIPFIQKYLVDYCDASDEVITSDHIQPKKVGQKVAIIGSGPAGLAAAAVLGQKGYEVTVFEAKKEVGGWLSYGIPPHRLPKEIIQKDLKYIKSLDVEFRTSCMVGRDITLDDLKKGPNEGKSVIVGYNTLISRNDLYCIQKHAALRAVNVPYTVQKYVKIVGNTATDTKGNTNNSKLNGRLAYIIAHGQGYGPDQYSCTPSPNLPGCRGRVPAHSPRPR